MEPDDSYSSAIRDSDSDHPAVDRLIKCIEPITEKEVIDHFNEAAKKVIEEIKNNPSNRQFRYLIRQNFRAFLIEEWFELNTKTMVCN